MNIEYNPYYRINKLLLSSIGQWPYQTKFQKLLLRNFHYIIVISLLIPEILEDLGFLVYYIMEFFRTHSLGRKPADGLVKYWGNVDMTIECLPPIIIIFACIILETNLIYKTDKMETIFSKINKDWNTWLSGSEAEILHSYARRGKMFSVFYTCYLFFTLVLYLCLPIVPQLLDIILPLNESRPKQTLYPTEYYLDEDYYFYSILLHGYIASLMCLITLASVDTIFMVFLQHTCGILEILGIKLKSILKNDHTDFVRNDAQIDKTIDLEIKFCAQNHKKIIEFVSDICDCFSTSFFLVLGFNIIIMSVTGVQTVMKLGQLDQCMRFGAFTFSQMCHLLYLTLPCQQLMDFSVNISDSIYNGYWYQLSPGSQKLLLMIMRRSLTPFTFTAGKIYTFSMQNYASILRTSMSYFTVLSSTR